MFDVFEAELTCPNCGTTNRRTIQTKVHERPQGRTFRVGDPLPIDPDLFRMELAYIALRPPKDQEPIRLIEEWACDDCDTGYLWAEVMIEGDRVKSLRTIRLTPELLEETHLLTPSVADYTGTRIDRTTMDLPSNKEIVPFLLQAIEKDQQSETWR